MRAVCLIALLVPAASLRQDLRSFLDQGLPVGDNIDSLRPQHALLWFEGHQDLEVVWQRPKGEPKGAFLWLHGCGNRALDMFTTKGARDGWTFPPCNTTRKGYCAGLPEEQNLKAIVRKRGYLLIAVDAGASSDRGCFHEDDVPRIQEAIQHVYKKENLGQKELIMAGMSAGGRTVGVLASQGAGVPMKCGASMVAEITAKGVNKFPPKVPFGFWHMPKDGKTMDLINADIKDFKNKKGCAIKKYHTNDRILFQAKKVDENELKAAKCIVEDHWIGEMQVNQQFLMAGGHGFNQETSNKVMKAFTESKLLTKMGTLEQDPYNPKPKSRWMKAIEKAHMKDEIGGFGQQAPMTKLMERAWGFHALAAERIDEIINFCEKKPEAHFEN